MKFGRKDSTIALVLTFERSPMFEMIVAFMQSYEEVNIFKGIDMRRVWGSRAESRSRGGESHPLPE